MRIVISVLLFLILSALESRTSFAQPPLNRTTDSIESTLAYLHGTERIATLSELCNQLYDLGDSAREQKYLRILFEENAQRGDTKAAGYSYTRLLVSYFNFDQYDRLEAALPDALAYLLETEQLDYYYTLRALQIDMYLLQERNYSALQEMQDMYHDALERRHIFGQAVAMYKIGVAYVQIYLETEPALASLKRCIELFSQMEHVDMIELDAHCDYCNVLYQAEQTDSLQRALVRWKSRLDKANAREIAENKGQLYTKYTYYYAAAVCTELLLGHKDRATLLLKSMETMASRGPSTIEPLVLDTREEYFKLLGQYDSALMYNQQLISSYRSAGLTALTSNRIRLRGNMFYRLGRYDSAAYCYHEYNVLRDSTETGLNANLLNELNTLFRVNELKAAQRLLNNRLVLSSLAAVLLATIVLLLVIYTHRLRRKNRLLYESIQKELQQRKERKGRSGTLPVSETPSEELPREMQLYNSLCLLMQEQKCFCDTNCNALSIAKALGTNRTYLTAAIKQYENGATFLEYINNLRLEYAAQLLTDSSNRISEIELMVGFNSRTTFYRLFKEKYGLSTSEYRKIAKEKQQTPNKGTSVSDEDTLDED